jgi:outer membrane receptor protein involved in Fe transport
MPTTLSSLRTTVFLALLLALPATSLAAEPSAPASAPANQGPELGGKDELDDAKLSDERNAAVVTAAGAEEQRAMASASVISVTYEEIAQRGYRSIGEVLADIPGLFVIDDLVLPSVSVRGVTAGFRGGSRIVKIMINGVPVNFRPDLTAFLGPEYIPLEMVERVEVAKGPLSALHGANAFLATVNVITRGQNNATPVIAEASGRAFLGPASAGYGGTIVGGYDEGATSLIVAATTERTDRSNLQISRTFADQDPTLARFRPFFGEASKGDLSTPTGVFAQFRARKPSFGSFLVQGGVQRLDSMGEFQQNSVLTHQSRIALENDWLSIRHEKSWSESFSTAAWLGFSRGAPTREEELYLTGNQNTAYDRRFGYEAVDGAAEMGWSFGEALALKGGVDVALERQRVLYYTAIFNAPQGQFQSGSTQDLVSSDDTTQVSFSNYGVYLQATSVPFASAGASALQLTANARVDLPNLYAAQYSWRAAAAYRWNSALTTKLVAGRAFQTPSAVLLFGLPGFGSSGNVIGNRTLNGVRPLNPQVVHTVEAATSLQLWRLAFEAGVYAQQVDDRIEFSQAGANFHARNQGQQRNVGVEASGRFVWGRLSLLAAGTLQKTLLDDEEASSDLPPAMYPNATGLGRLNLNVPELYFNLNTQVRWVGPRGSSQSNAALNNYTAYMLPAYATWDVTVASVGLNFLGGAQTTLSVGVRNLLDRRYSEPGFGGFDVPNLGRTAVIELRQAY